MQKSACTSAVSADAWGKLFITVQAVHNGPGDAGETSRQRPGLGNSRLAPRTPEGCPGRLMSRSTRSQKVACVTTVRSVLKGLHETTDASRGGDGNPRGARTDFLRLAPSLTN